MVSKNLGVSHQPASRIFPIIGLFFAFINLWECIHIDTSLPILVDIPSPSLEINTEDEVTWADFDCFQPLPRPILGDYNKNWRNGSSANIKAPKIINVGFPKVGSTTLNDFLSIAQPYNLPNPKALVSHFWPCNGGNVSKLGSLLYGGNNSYNPTCGNCIQDSINKGLPPLTTCGDYAAYTQLDSNLGEECIYPQISYLKEMYEEGPSSIFVLPFRNVTDWIRSLTNWNQPTMRKRMINNCEFPEYNLTKGWGTDKDLEDLYCKHVKHIRQFVSRRPTLTLVEYSISREDVGDYLTSSLPHMNMNGSDYGHANAKMTAVKAT